MIHEIKRIGIKSKILLESMKLDEYGELLTTYTPFHAENNEGLPLTNEVREYIDNFMDVTCPNSLQ
jgi:hypothetical protein